MNFKEKLVKKLTNIGKKHRILIYPTLAVIAVITAISQFIYWSKGNGKKLVASIMVLALLITQSLFLTSSADYSESEAVASNTDATKVVDTESGEDETVVETTDGGEETYDFQIDAMNAGGENDPEIDPAKPIIELYAVTTTTSGNASRLVYKVNTTLTADENEVNVPSFSEADLVAYAGYDSTYFGCKDNTQLYKDSDVTAPAGTTLVKHTDTTDLVYKLYYQVYRTRYDIQITDGSATGNLGTYDYPWDIESLNVNKLLNPSVDYPVGTASTYDFYQRGYKYNGLSKGDTSYEIGSAIPIRLATTEKVANLTSNWTAMKDTDNEGGLKITLDVFGPESSFLDNGAEATMLYKTNLTYGQSVTLPSATEVAAYTDNIGYRLVKWTDGTNDYAPGETYNFTVETGLAVNAGEVSAPINVAGTTLYGVWEYVNIDIYLDGVKMEGTTIELEGTYGEPFNHTISAKYKNGTGGNNFSYGGTFGPELGTKYGVGLTNQENGYNLNSIALANVTPADGETYTFAVEDTNYNDNGGKVTCTLKFKVNKREVTIGDIQNASSAAKPSKPYDGTDIISVNATAKAENSLAADGIIVKFDPTATLLETDGVAGKDVGVNKDIRLSNAHLETTLEDQSVLDRYELKGVTSGTAVIPGAANVTQRQIHVDMALADGSSNSVLFGADHPKYTLSISDTDEIAPAELTYYDASNPEAFMKTYLGLKDPSQWTTNRDYYSPVGNNYTMEAKFDTSPSANYLVIVNNPQTFSVTRDKTETNYEVLETPVGGYYPSYTIHPLNGYNAVRLLSGNANDIQIYTPRETAKGMFQSGDKSITQNGQDQTITFQLLNTNTGAISTVYTVTGINIDSQFPVYQSHTVDPVGLVNSFGYGSYYHSQNSINGMTIEVIYKGEVSPCKTLHYYFVGADATEVPATELTTTMTRVSGNLYKGTITVGTGFSGQLVVYAEDEAGKHSAKTKLLTNSDAELNKPYYEWMTENNPSTADMTVLGNGETASANQWYSNLSATVVAKDGDSGINNIKWVVTTPSTVLDYTDNTPANVVNATYCGKVLEGTFTNTISGNTSSIGGTSSSYVPGQYYIEAEITDNAGNVYKVPQQGPFLYDGNAPSVKITDSSDTGSQYRSDVKITIDAADGENESGLATVKLYKDSISDDTLIRSWGDEGKYEYEVVDSGTYYVVATDIAGNAAQDQVTYTYISSERPVKPTITVDKGKGEYGNQAWFIKDKPVVTINSSTQTPKDKVPVTTYYKVTVTNANGKQESTSSFTTASTSFELPYEGEVTVEAWAVSESDCQSDKASELVKADVNAPVVAITDSTVDSDGKVNISFRITDLVSGVDTNKVLVNGSPIAVTDVDGVVTGSFKGDGTGVYELVAHDVAGNVSEAVSFTPLGLKVAPITKITSTTAQINAQVLKGTNPISPTNCYIEYKPVDDVSYDTVLVDKDTTDYGLAMGYEFTKLVPDTVYEYRVHAATAGEDEVRVVTGTFRTLTGSDNTSIYGTVTYDVNLDDNYKKYPIYVNLYQGNVQVGGETILTEDNPEYLFKGVADGTYRIVATNGFLSKETKVVVEDGGISYPANYASANGVNFELSGLSTSVVIDDGEVELAVDGLDKIYNTSLYKGNVTSEDLKTVQQGGSIDICLHASYIKVNDISSTESGIFAERLGERAEIVRYINLYIVKTVYNADGSVKYTQNLTRLAEPIAISFPLEELSGETIYVASVHSNGANYDFKNWKDAEDATITTNYVVISTDRFSTYALYRLLDKEKFLVTWKDGDGNVLKTEYVEDGSAATPPEGTPTKTPTDKYYYTFEGWDQDYSAIDRETVILALFYSHKVDDKDPDDPGNTPGGDTPGGDTPSGNTPGGNTPGGNDKPGNNQAPGATVTPGDTSKQPNTQPTYTYMGGAGSPQTGDEAPVVMLVSLMGVAGVAMILLMKKRKED